MIAVNTDASYREDLGRAGIAYVTPSGSNSHVVDAQDSMEAELKALCWAMAVMAARGVQNVTFRHDAVMPLSGPSTHPPTRAARELIGNALSAHGGWRLERIPRTMNVRANALARRALKMEIGGAMQKAHCEQAAERERRTGG